MTKAQSDFINLIGSAALKFYPQYEILPSLTIAQAILESNWGKSGLSASCYNYFGMKWTAGCGCDYKEYNTKEQLKDGKYITISAKFRKYNSPDDGILGYYQFLQYKRYQNLRGVKDAGTACYLIRQDGWATSLKYSENLLSYIQKYELTKWDELAFAGVRPPEFFTGNYIVTASALRVRSGPGICYEQKKFTDMTVMAQIKNISKATTGLAFYILGLKFTVRDAIKISDNEWWAETPSGYVALKYNGIVYVKRA